MSSCEVEAEDGGGRVILNGLCFNVGVDGGPLGENLIAWPHCVIVPYPDPQLGLAEFWLVNKQKPVGLEGACLLADGMSTNSSSRSVEDTWCFKSPPGVFESH